MTSHLTVHQMLKKRNRKGMKREEDSPNWPDHEPIRRRGEDNNYHIHQKSRRNK